VTGVPDGRVAEVCDQVGLAEAGDRRVGVYSLGMTDAHHQSVKDLR